MFKVMSTLAAAAIAVCAATSAHAISFTPNVDGAFTFTFIWGDKPESEFHTMDIGFDYDLTIEGVTGANPAIGYTVLDGSGTFLADTTFPFSVSTCATSGGGVDDCNLMYSSEATPKSLFTNLSAGTFTFGVFGGTNTQEGSITFGISKVSPVPLPAAGLLMLGALGGVGALRRRRKA
jgi:hypothetical protein